jgi:hypothetical protein
MLVAESAANMPTEKVFSVQRLVCIAAVTLVAWFGSTPNAFAQG